MSASDIRAGRAFVELTLKNGLVQGLSRARQQLQNFASTVKRVGRALATIGTAMTAPFLAAVYKIDAVRTKLGEVSKVLGEALAPAIMPILDSTLKVARGFSQWARSNPKTVSQILRIGTALVGVGVAFKVAAAGASLMAVAVGAISAAATFIAGSPILATVLGIGAALGATGSAFLYFTSSGQSAFQGIKSTAMTLLETVKTALGGIGDALMAGDLQLAGQIAITGLKLVFIQGVEAIADAIGGTFGAAIGTIGSQLIKGDLAGAWNTTIASMAALWAKFSEGVVSVFSAAATAVTNKWQATVNGIANGLLKASAQGGVMGKIASLIVGADVSKIKAENDRVDAERQRRGLGGPQDILGIGAGSVNDTTNAMRGPVDDFLNGMAQAAGDAGVEAGNNLKDKLNPAGADRAELDRLRAQLANMNKQAAAERGAVDNTITGKTVNAATTSAAGALALSSGGGIAGVQGQMLRVLKNIDKGIGDQNRKRFVLNAV